MTTTIPVRRAAATTVAIAALAGIAVAPTYAGTDPRAGVAPDRAPARTTLTVKAPDCAGCTIELQQGRYDPDGDPTVWYGPEKPVRDGSATFRVPTRRTHGMSMLVRAPWEGHLPFITTVAFRYGHERVGDHVGRREARSKKRGTACWAGTTDRRATIRLATHRVWVPGDARPWVRGTLAYTPVTQEWMRPMRYVRHGVLGSQDINICDDVHVAATP